MSRNVRTWLIPLALVIAVAVAALGIMVYLRGRQLPSASSSVTVLRPAPNVLLAVRGLARLESVSFHMERVIDLSDKQSRLFGLIESEDAILLVAVANVTAGVDLQRLNSASIDVDPNSRMVRVRLPPAEIFSVALDNDHTYVHTRRTGLIAQRKEDLETRARTEAERALLDAARQAGILTTASKNAQRAVEALLRSLGFETIDVIATPQPN